MSDVQDLASEGGAGTEPADFGVTAALEPSNEILAIVTNQLSLVRMTSGAWAVSCATGQRLCPDAGCPWCRCGPQGFCLFALPDTSRRRRGR